MRSHELNTFNIEDNDQSRIKKPDGNQLFNAFYHFEQMRDQYQACLYVEKTFATLNFQTLNEELLEEFIKAIHGIAAKSLLLVNPKHNVVMTEKLRAYCQHLLQSAQSNSDPINCATFALFHFIDGNFFSCGNKRTARIFVNGLLKALQQELIIMQGETLSEYNSALEQSSSDNLMPLFDVMNKDANEAKNTNMTMRLVLEGMSPVPLADDLVMKTYDQYYQIEEQKTESHSEAKQVRHFDSLINKKLDRDFFLKQAIKYSKSIPAIAAFYLECSRALGSEIGSTNIKVDQVAKLLQKNAKPCPVIYLAPNETARITKSENQAAFWVKLAFIDKVFIFRDQEGNLSVTHTDSRSDKKDLLRREAQFMKGKFTVDIFHSGKSTLYSRENNLIAVIEKHLGDIKNSEGKKELRVTNTGCIFIHREKILFPLEDDLKAISSVSHDQLQDLTDSPLCGYKLNEPEITYPTRERARIAMRAFAPQPEEPVVIFQNDWTGNYPAQRSSTYDDIMQKTLNICHHDPELQKYKRIKAIQQEIAKAIQLNPSSAFPPDEAETAAQKIYEYMNLAEPQTQEEKSSLDSTKINIEGLNKAEVLMALYNNAKPQALERMSLNEAEKYLAETSYFDYLQSKCLKINLSNDSFNPFLYDRDNGTNSAKQTILSLREEKEEKNTIREFNRSQLGDNDITIHLLQRLLQSKQPLLQKSSAFTAYDAELQCKQLADLLEMYIEALTEGEKLRESKHHFTIIASLTSLFSLYKPLLKDPTFLHALFVPAQKIEASINMQECDDLALSVLAKFTIANQNTDNNFETNSFCKATRYLLAIQKPKFDDICLYESCIRFSCPAQDTEQKIEFYNRRLININNIAKAYHPIILQNTSNELYIISQSKLDRKLKESITEAYKKMLEICSDNKKLFKKIDKQYKDYQASLKPSLIPIEKNPISVESKPVSPLLFVNEYQAKHPNADAAKIQQLEEYLRNVGNLDEKEHFIESKEQFEVNLKEIFREAKKSKPALYPNTYLLLQDDIETILSESFIEHCVCQLISRKIKETLPPPKSSTNTSALTAISNILNSETPLLDAMASGNQSSDLSVAMISAPSTTPVPNIQTTSTKSINDTEVKKAKEPKFSKRDLQQQKYQDSIRAKEEADMQAKKAEKIKNEKLELEQKRRKEAYLALKEQEKKDRENQKKKEEAAETKLRETIITSITEKQKACLDQVFLKCWQIRSLKTRRMTNEPDLTEDKAVDSQSHPITPTTKHFALIYEVFRCFQMMKTYKEEFYRNSALKNLPESNEEINLYKGLKKLRHRIIHRGAEITTSDDLNEITDEILKKFPRKFLHQDNKEFVNVWAYSLTEEQRKDWICEFGFTTNKERYKIYEYQLMLDQTDLYSRLNEFHDDRGETKEEPEKLIAMIMETYIPKIQEMIQTIDSKSMGIVGFEKSYMNRPQIFIHTYFFELLALRMLVTICGELSDVAQHTENPEFKSFMTYCREVRNEVGHEIDDYQCKDKPDLAFFIKIWVHIMNMNMRKLKDFNSVTQKQESSASSHGNKSVSIYDAIGNQNQNFHPKNYNNTGFYGANTKKKKNKQQTKPTANSNNIKTLG